jgi:hypothetical protein
LKTALKVIDESSDYLTSIEDENLKVISFYSKESKFISKLQESLENLILKVRKVQNCSIIATGIEMFSNLLDS